MRTLVHQIAGDPAAFWFYEGPEDMERFVDWLEDPRLALAVDTETTGLNIYAADHECRLVQFGDEHGGWAIPARHLEPIQRAVRGAKRLIAHNAPYDLLVLDRHLGLPLEETAHKTIDTYILSHILDNRGREDGGIGHGLKDLATKYVDPASADGQRELKAVFAENKWTIDNGWKLIPEDHETYWRYGVLDTVLTARLFYELMPLMGGFEELSRFEHTLMSFLLRRQRAGLKVDVNYLEGLHHQLTDDVELHNKAINEILYRVGELPLTPRGQKVALTAVAWALGAAVKWPRGTTPAYQEVTASCNGPISKALIAMGEDMGKMTDTGKVSVDKAVLWSLCDVDADGNRRGQREPNELADHVRLAKRAQKWDSAYVGAMLTGKDENDRVHAQLNGLKARTARMSVSEPPFQQLPSKGALIRHGIVADPGHLIISSDFSQIEPRVLAGLSDCKQVIEQAQAGEDIYDAVTKIMFGEDFTKNERKRTKIVYLGRGYQGGLRGLMAQTGEPEDVVQAAINAIDEALPETRLYGQQLMKDMKRTGVYEIRTPVFGRRLYIDEDRAYACVNHMVQSTARDLFAQAMLDIDAAGLGDTVLMPVHDEVLGQAPIADAEEIAHEYARIMSREFMGVPLPAEGEVYGPSWGSGYE